MLIDDLVINILLILFIYLVIFSVYYAFTVFVATKKKQIGLEQKYLAQDLPSNLIVIIYADDANPNILNLVKALSTQKYPAENYNVHVLFDNVNDDIVDKTDNISGAKVWRINKGVKMGKDEALSWLLEKLISFKNVNAFVFVDSNRLVNNDFLQEINKALFWGDIVVASKEYVCDEEDMVSQVKNQVLKYCNRIFNTSRTLLKLISPIDSGAVAIKQEVLELVQCVDFQTKKLEYMYTLFLASKGYIPMFAPDVKSYAPAENETILSNKDKIDIIKYGFSRFMGSKLKIFEFLTTFLKPNIGIILFLYLGFFIFLYNFEVKNMFFYDAKFIIAGAVITFGIFIASLFVAKDENLEPAKLFLYPVYSILDKIFSRVKKQKEVTPVPQEEIDDKRGVGQSVKVSDGNSILNCTLELKNTGDGKKVIFRYKDKKIESEVYQSPKDAISEIADKLHSFGLRIMICSTCAHFGFKPNADTTKLAGICSCKEKMTEDIHFDTNLLSSCEYYNALIDLNNVVEFPKENN